MDIDMTTNSTKEDNNNSHFLTNYAPKDPTPVITAHR